MLLKPGNEIASGGELLVMEVEARAADLDQFADGIALLEHVDQQNELRVVLGDTEVVVDVTAVLLGLPTSLVLDGFDRHIQKLLIGGDVLHQHIHRLDALFDDFFKTVVAAVVTVFNAVGHVHAVDASVFALHLDVHNHSFEELPCYSQVFRTLRTGSDYEVSDAYL